MKEIHSFYVGVILHIILIFTRINFSPLGCINNDCSSLIVADIPVCILYLAFPDVFLILFSLILGSLLWGIYFWVIYKLLKYLFK